MQPVLLAVPSSALALWESEWALWAPDANVVPYCGSLASRAVLMDHELWLNASSLDGKATGKLKDEMPSEVSHASSDVQVLYADISARAAMLNAQHAQSCVRHK